MKRFLVFLGLLSLLLLVAAAASAAIAQQGWLKVLIHRNFGYALLLPAAAYIVLSLQWILRTPAPGRESSAPAEGRPAGSP